MTNRKLYSKGIVITVSVLLILCLLIPIVFLGFIPQFVTLDEIGGQVGAGVLIGCFVSFIMVYPTIARFFTKHITMPYHLLHKQKYRWGLGVVYQDEIDKYTAWRGSNDVYILLDKATGEIVNKNVHPPIDSLGKRVIWILITVVITAIITLVFLLTDEEHICVATACFLTSLMALFLVIFRTIKPEY